MTSEEPGPGVELNVPADRLAMSGVGGPAASPPPAPPAPLASVSLDSLLRSGALELVLRRTWFIGSTYRHGSSWRCRTASGASMISDAARGVGHLMVTSCGGGA